MTYDSDAGLEVAASEVAHASHGGGVSAGERGAFRDTEADVPESIAPMIPLLARLDPMSRAVMTDMLKRLHWVQVEISGTPGVPGLKGDVAAMRVEIGYNVIATNEMKSAVKDNTMVLNTVLQNARLKESPWTLVAAGAAGWTLVVGVFAVLAIAMHKAGVF